MRLLLFFAVAALVAQPPAPPASAPPAAPAAPAPASDYFSYPLPTWLPHCLGYGSEWRLCDGTVLRACPNGAIWRHTGVDIRTGVQPVMAAADGVIIGYVVDPTFRGGILIRHQTSFGVVITQYWHVWPRPGFSVGVHVTRGQYFANIADMGSRTHLHFAVFLGDYEVTAWRGALPPRSCDGFPAFPYRFTDPNAFLTAHSPPVPAPVPAHRHTCLRGPNSEV